MKKNIVDMTYQELMTKAKNCTTRQRKSQVMQFAEKKYPEVFQRDDFTRSCDRVNLSYTELVSLHNIRVDKNSRIKKEAKKRPEYNEIDFPRKKSVGSHIHTYFDAVVKYNLLSNVDNLSKNKLVYRAVLKMVTKKKFPEEFHDEDFLKRKNIKR